VSVPPSTSPPSCRQQDLFRVLKAYTLYRPEEGYCQAQAPIAAVLLMHMPAEVWGSCCWHQWGGAGGHSAQLVALRYPEAQPSAPVCSVRSRGAKRGCRAVPRRCLQLTCCPLACSKRSGAWCRSVRSTSPATTARSW